jgi:hypothetical protein
VGHFDVRLVQQQQVARGVRARHLITSVSGRQDQSAYGSAMRNAQWNIGTASAC